MAPVTDILNSPVMISFLNSLLVTSRKFYSEILKTNLIHSSFFFYSTYAPQFNKFNADRM